jgi:DNA (cytosine-5)-methyltransferase 1
MIGVLDIFAGPGGLAEGFGGFTAPSGAHPFEVCLSIEKDARAHETLKLRSFVRQFRGGSLPHNYCKRLKEGADGVSSLYLENPRESRRATDEAWLAELGEVKDADIDKRIRGALPRNSEWVLIGGPPCQAYSLVGRSRMTADRKKYETDPRHHLYLQYLRLLEVHRPAAFVMENVKGLLSSEVNGKKTLDNILRDLKDLRYRLYSLVSGKEYTGAETDDPADFVIRTELYGIPQRRHRIIILGVRDDLKFSPRALTPQLKSKTVRTVIGSAPRLYSTISRGKHTAALLISTLRGVRSIGTSHMDDGSAFKIHLQSQVDQTIENLDRMGDVGLEHALKAASQQHNHEARSHMPSDLQRYLFASAYADFYGKSPSLVDFPIRLLPEHENVAAGVAGDTFADRFRVQCWDSPSTTVTSHIAKDGHYFIHPDPTQFRSLTVREAARLQTFPDNYFFMGPRTSQYQQVGNAVPPELARQIAAVVFEMFCAKGGHNG